MPRRKPVYVIDEVARQPDPNMANFGFYPYSQVSAHEAQAGQAIHDFLTSRLGVAVLIGSVLAAPTRPPIVAAEPFLAALVGDAAFTVEMKKYTGRVIRQIVEHLGGTFVRRAVKVTVSSRYGSGSIYSFDNGFVIDDSVEAHAALAANVDHRNRIMQDEARWAARNAQR